MAIEEADVELARVAMKAYLDEGALWFLKSESEPPFEVRRDKEVLFSSDDWNEAYEYLAPQETKAQWLAVVRAIKKHLEAVK